MAQRSTPARFPSTPARPPIARVTPLDRFRLYEACVQSPGYDARMLAAIHGGSGRLAPRILGEDFCGSAALSRAWVDLHPKNTAIAVDRDRETIEAAIALSGEPFDRSRPGLSSNGEAPSAGGSADDAGGPRSAMTFVLADVLRAPRSPRPDVLCALNYSIGEWHTRADLSRYLRVARKRVAPCGVFIADLYAGTESMLTGDTHRLIDLPPWGRVRYTWEQRHADPLTGLVENAIHFHLGASKARAQARRHAPSLELRDAFVYRWRLWGIPELREAMLEAGFRSTQVYPRHAEAVDDRGQFHAVPLADPDELPESFSCYVVGRV